MSRVGKNEVVIPSGITITRSGNQVTINGKAVSMVYDIPDCINFESTPSGFKISPKDDSQKARSLWGTTQRNLANMVKGLSVGYKINIALVGVGYRAAVAGKVLTLQLGYSHDIVYDIPEGIVITCEKPTAIAVSGYSKELVGKVAARLRMFRKPEPYKGKGVIREGEFVRRKEGKKK